MNSLKSVATIAVQIIEMIQTSKDNKEDCAEIVQTIGATLKRLQPAIEKTNVGDELGQVIREFTTVLQQVRAMLLKISRRRAICRVLWSAADRCSIRKCKGKMKEAQLRLLVDRTISQCIDQAELRQLIVSRWPSSETTNFKAHYLTELLGKLNVILFVHGG